jgi:hypothetical protein
MAGVGLSPSSRAADCQGDGVSGGPGPARDAPAAPAPAPAPAPGDCGPPTRDDQSSKRDRSLLGRLRRLKGAWHGNQRADEDNSQVTPGLPANAFLTPKRVCSPSTVRDNARDGGVSAPISVLARLQHQDSAQHIAAAPARPDRAPPPPPSAQT